ncbi:MAG: DotI/IcmL family type IV secretion protein, partial [Alphaproteobacteria bacterium]|nr:DotI/IcmL family type IV secretion protein [Alphaproteobacteria bacterium]
MAQSAKPAPNEPQTRDTPADDTSGLGRVVIRNEFYRDGYRNMLRLVVIQGAVILGLLIVVFMILQAREPENRYFATTEDGRLVPMVPLNQPNLSTPALMSWTAQAATEVMTFGFNDYRRRLQE